MVRGKPVDPQKVEELFGYLANHVKAWTSGEHYVTFVSLDPSDAEAIVNKFKNPTGMTPKEQIAVAIRVVRPASPGAQKSASTISQSSQGDGAIVAMMIVPTDLEVDGG